MTGISNLMSAISGLGWLVLAVVVTIVVLRAVKPRMKDLTKLGAGPSGVTMEFAERALDEAVRSGDPQQAASTGTVAKRGILRRLARNSDLLARARVLWVDDHPENNRSIVEMLTRFGVRVDVPRSNAEAATLMAANRYDVFISDVARDEEGPDSDLKGVEFAEQVHDKTGQKVVLFTSRFDPLKLPGYSDADRLKLAQTVGRTVFGRTNRYDEALHLVLDILERAM